MVHTVATELGRIDLLVNNAAILRPAPLEKIELASARELWEINVLGPTLLAQAAPPHRDTDTGSSCQACPPARRASPNAADDAFRRRRGMYDLGLAHACKDAGKVIAGLG